MPYSSRRQVEITNGLGLHLRAASRLVQLAQQFQSEVRVLCEGRTANGKSILDLLTLAAQRGSRLESRPAGPTPRKPPRPFTSSLRPVSKSAKSLHTLMNGVSHELVWATTTQTLPEAKDQWTLLDCSCYSQQGRGASPRPYPPLIPVPRGREKEGKGVVTE